MAYAKPVVEIPPTPAYPARRKLIILAVYSSEPGTPPDFCLYAILGCDASPACVSITALRPFITAGKILS